MAQLSDESQQNPSRSSGVSRYLGFDFGEKRIGIAIGQIISGTASSTGTDSSSGTVSANPLQAVKNINGRPEWDEIAAFVEEWKPVALIVGLPLTEDGETQRLTALAKSFAKHLRKRYQLPVHYCDERYSSNEASRIIADNRHHHNRRRANREDHDTIAAALILEQWLNDPSREN